MRSIAFSRLRRSALRVCMTKYYRMVVDLLICDTGLLAAESEADRGYLYQQTVPMHTVTFAVDVAGITGTGDAGQMVEPEGDCAGAPVGVRSVICYREVMMRARGPEPSVDQVRP